jgi:hypothetical protein
MHHYIFQTNDVFISSHFLCYGRHISLMYIRDYKHNLFFNSAEEKRTHLLLLPYYLSVKRLIYI